MFDYMKSILAYSGWVEYFGRVMHMVICFATINTDKTEKTVAM